MEINKKELAVGNTAYLVTKKYSTKQMKQVYHIDPLKLKRLAVNILQPLFSTEIRNIA